MCCRTGIAVIAVLAGWPNGPATAASYAEMRAAAVRQCATIDPSEYQTGLAFNPEGYQSYYARSKCYQDAAKLFRDDSLWAHARERWSLFSSSWGYSGKRCRQLVAEGAAADRKALEGIKSRSREGAVKLRDFRIERNGNGCDFDIIRSDQSQEPSPVSGWSNQPPGSTVREVMRWRKPDRITAHAVQALLRKG